MKKLNQQILFSSILIFSLFGNLHSEPSWVMRSTGTNIYSVFSLDMSTAWAVGDSGLILATIDGGVNWLCVNTCVSNSLKSVFFIDAFTGWIAGSGGIILKSINGGTNWTSLTTGTSSSFESVHFATKDTGIAVGPSVTLKTTNGGTTWTSLVSLSSNAVLLTGTMNGFALRSSASLHRTTNGGLTWFTDVFGYPSSRYGISFISSFTGWVSGAGTTIHKTTDGGANWISFPTGLSGFPVMYGIDFTDLSTGFCAGTSGIVIRTTSGGTLWSSLSSGTLNALRSVSFADENTGWFCGEKGTLLTTTNSGESFVNQLTLYESPFVHGNTLSSVHMRNSTTGWTTGFGGIVNKTTDGGKSWTSYSTSSFNWLYSLDFLESGDTGFVCGRLGTIQRTNNGGINWTLQTSGTSQHLNSIVVQKYFGDTNETVWCVGNAGTVVKSASGGMSWTASVIAAFDINDIAVISEFVALIAGSGGNIYKTTDGGSNFSMLSSGTSEDIRSIYFQNSMTGYICGTTGMIRKTSDGGDSWYSLTSGTSISLNSIMFEDDNYENGYAVGEGGTILATSDFGATWHTEAGGSSTTLNSVFAKSDNDSPEGQIVCAAGTFSKFVRRVIPVALAVEMLSLDNFVSGNDVHLSWSTSFEINNRGFEIERNSGAGWKMIGFMPGKGMPSGRSDYSYEDRGLAEGKHSYRLKQLDFNGRHAYYNFRNPAEISTPVNFELFQNYPNPFNPSTTIKFTIDKGSVIRLSLYDLAGRTIQTIMEGFVEQGTHFAKLDATGLSSGTYICILDSESKRSSVKMVLMK